MVIKMMKSKFLQVIKAEAKRLDGNPINPH